MKNFSQTTESHYKQGKRMIFSLSFLILIFQFLILNSVFAQSGLWTRRADFGGTAREYAVGFSIGHKGYIGTGHSGSLKNDFWEYDPFANTWTQKADFVGGGRFEAVGFAIGNKGYIGTGTMFNRLGTKDFWEYNPSTNSWTQKANFAGEARWGAIGFSIENKGYIGTGYMDSSSYSSKYSKYFPDFWEYDPSLDKWTKKADFGDRVGAVGFSIGAKGYVGTGNYRKDFWEYDTKKDKWTRMADFGGDGRSDAVGLSIGSKGYVGTGIDAIINYKNDFWEYNPDSNLWTQKTNFGGAIRQRSSGFSFDNKGFIGVGYNNGGNYNDFWEYNPDLFPNKITGKIFVDTDGDCKFNSKDYNLRDYIVKAMPGSYYGYSDVSGNYTIYTDSGTYSVFPVSQSALLKNTCTTSYQVSFKKFGDSATGKDFAYQAQYYCSKLWVDVAAPRIRKWGNNYFTVNYCNKGTMPADSAKIKIKFDDYIIPQSSTLAWSSTKDNEYVFNVGKLEINQCGTFYITTKADSAIVGSTHCVEARIFPDSICLPTDKAWDKSSIRVTGKCITDSITRFVIYNDGSDMQGTSEYRIYVDNALAQTQTFQLKANDSLVLNLSTCDNTIRFEADQRHGHPGKSKPRVTIEGCEDKCLPTVYGYTNQVSKDDADDFVAIDCHTVIASYDPNEKTVHPIGITANHYIKAEDDLEYQIEFQNTGTDTAFRVIIRDTISPLLDLSTLVSGASSHPYKFTITGGGTAEWDFNNILLPDSNVDKKGGSCGFVKFRISQTANNPKGTVIKNNARIYFDFNAPVITNTTVNVVYDTTLVYAGKLIFTRVENKFKVLGSQLNVFPNPSDGRFTLTLSDREGNSNNQSRTTNNYQLTIYDVLGQVIFQRTTNNEQSTTINLKYAPSGVYFLQLQTEEGMVYGKLLKE